MAYRNDAFVVSTLRLVVAVTLAGLFFTGLATAWAYPDPTPHLGVLAGTAALALAAHGIARRGHARLGGVIFVAGVWAGTTVGALLPGNEVAPISMAFLFAVVAAGLLVADWFAGLAALVCVATLLGLHWASESGIVASATHSGFLIWTHSAVLLTGAALVAVAMNRLHHALQQSWRSEARYRTLVDNAPLGVLTIDPQGRIAMANRAFSEMVGAPEPAVLFGNAIRETPSWSPEIRDAMHRCLEKGETGAIDAGWTSRFGGAVDVRFHGAPIRDDEDRIVGMQAIVEDVSERRRAEERATRLGRILEAARNEIYVFDAETLRFVLVNRGARENLGYEMAELRNLTPLDLKPDYTRERFEALIAPLRAGRSEVRFETVHRRKDGSTYPVEVHLRRSVDSSSQVFVAIVHDTTERERATAAQRSLELQLVQAQKMEAVGLLAGGIAHDFNNLLTVIEGNAGLLLSSLDEPGELRESAEEVHEAARRAGELTRQLLQFSRKEPLHPKRLELNRLLAGLESMLRRLIGREVAFEVLRDAEVGPVYVDPVQLEQVIVNLAVNARDAMPEGGRLRISIREEELAAGAEQGAEGAKPGRYAVIAVSDTGAGMSEEVQARIFEPFFTTKPPGMGTGLGLSTSYGVVRQSGGLMRVRSTPGRGSTFEVLLPRVESEASDPVAIGATAAARDSRAGTILLVEDEAAVRRLLAKVLEQEGHRVVAAADGSEALALARTRPDTIDVLVSDIVMPGLAVAELDEAVRELHPRVRTILISGHPMRAGLPCAIPEQAQLLRKPFSPEQLVSAVGEALRG